MPEHLPKADAAVGQPAAAPEARPFVTDPDFTLWLGDVREVLPSLPAESVDCCVTSPPYWGLRDYGADGQLGLEASPDEYVAAMVAVFREVRRVLRRDGTLWLNLGDSYASGEVGRKDNGRLKADQERWRQGMTDQKPRAERDLARPAGLKPKDLVGIPWRVAFALQADGWYLRSDIIWAKPNPMPESVTDRPTKAHEYVFLLSRQPRYFFDQEAVREPVTGNAHGRGNGVNPKSLVNEPGRGVKQNASFSAAVNELVSARNVRSVWEIATQPYPDAHFATFPEELPRRCIAAGCPTHICRVCGKPRERIVSKELHATRGKVGEHKGEGRADPQDAGSQWNHSGGGVYGVYETETLGWTDCGHDNYRPGVILDPFMGSGTTALVARRLGRRSVGVELNEEYARLAAKRLQQLSLLAEEGAA